eukprot:CAMPEP_0172945520 /NCGR_PEP_ID=MMETSP1075-20121228/226593_1 /TAXON_ID=2916 /ORGANISM="Ceratium fusus, Strain PA161109" /LENGTH=118 /DNA_ID=CAMNT_0013806961 /DNA_START=666 /DNA_END=1022 /DNA_ORIENTATION=+
MKPNSRSGLDGQIVKGALLLPPTAQANIPYGVCYVHKAFSNRDTVDICRNPGPVEHQLQLVDNILTRCRMQYHNLLQENLPSIQACLATCTIHPQTITLPIPIFGPIPKELVARDAAA